MSEPAEQMRPMRRRRHSRAAVDLRGVPYQPGPLDDSTELSRDGEPPDTNPQGLFGIPRSVLPARARPAATKQAEPDEQSRDPAATPRTLYPVSPPRSDAAAEDADGPDEARRSDDPFPMTLSVRNISFPVPGPAAASASTTRAESFAAPPATRATKTAGVPAAMAAEPDPFPTGMGFGQPHPAQQDTGSTFTPAEADAPFDFTPPAEDGPFQFIPAANDVDDDPFDFTGRSPTSPLTAHPSAPVRAPDESPFAFVPAAPQEQLLPAPAKRSLFRRVDPSWGAVVALTVILGGLGGAAWGITHPPQYSGRADFVIDATVDLTGAPATALQQATDRDVATQAELLGNQGVQATAIVYLRSKAFEVKTRSDKDSNVISVSVTAPSYTAAKRARAAYTKAYLHLVATQQGTLLDPQMAVATQAIRFDLKSLAALDADLLATAKGQRATLIAQQNAQRLNITSDLRDNQQRQARLAAAQKSLPVNVHPLPEETPIEPSGLGALQWTALGLTLGAGTGAVISLRLAERRSLAARLL